MNKYPLLTLAVLACAAGYGQQLSDDNSLWVPSNKIQALGTCATHRVTKVEMDTQTGVGLWKELDVWGVQVPPDGSLQAMVGNQRVSPMRYVQIVWNVQRAE